jgi:hypothetical protein
MHQDRRSLRARGLRGPPNTVQIRIIGVEMARKTHPFVWNMSVHASVFYVSCLVFSSTFADNSPYLNRIGLHRVEAIIDIANVRSKNLLLKLGFTYEGYLRQRFPFRGQFLNEYYFGLLNDEWHGPK